MLAGVDENIVNSMPASLIGNSGAISDITSAADSGRLSRSIILAGPTGCGRKTLALRLAAVFAAQGHIGQDFHLAMDSLPDIVRHSMRLLGQGAHPDILLIQPEGKKGVISAEAARELQSFQSTTPAFGRGKTAVIMDADALNVQSANAILKVLEEPKPTLSVILVSSQVQSILPTIRSRCVQFRLSSPSRPEVESIIQAHGETVSSEALGLVDGDAGLALHLAKADLDLGVLDIAVQFCVGSTPRLAPSLGTALTTLDKALGTAVVSRLLLSKSRKTIREKGQSIAAFEKRLGQRATLSLDSTASWMDALSQLRAMLDVNHK